MPLSQKSYLALCGKRGAGQCEQETDDRIDSEREPIGTDVLDDLPFFDFTHALVLTFADLTSGLPGVVPSATWKRFDHVLVWHDHLSVLNCLSWFVPSNLNNS